MEDIMTNTGGLLKSLATGVGLLLVSTLVIRAAASGDDGKTDEPLVRLFENRPNPFNPSTEIPFWLDRRARVKLTVHDVAGNRVAILLDRELGAGPHARLWDGRDSRGEAVPSGVYYYRLVTSTAVLSKKAVLLK
jgi:hypothetical protein